MIIESLEKLQQQLKRLDGKGYKAYTDIKGDYQAEGYRLHIDHVQGDPYATPSRIRVSLTFKEVDLKKEWWETRHRKIALEDFFARRMGEAIRKNSTKGDPKKTGYFKVDEPGQEILKRTAVKVERHGLEFRLSAGLPARGRTILGQAAQRMFIELLPQLLKKTVRHFSPQQLQRHLQLADQQTAIRTYLSEQGYRSIFDTGRQRQYVASGQYYGDAGGGNALLAD